MGNSTKRPRRPEDIPTAPEPSAASASEGMERAREEARRYLLDNVRAYAAIAHSPDSEARLQTKVTCMKQMDVIAGVIPQPIPTTPPPHDGDDGSGDLAS